MALNTAQKINQTLFFEESFGRLSQLEELLTVQNLPLDEWRNVIYRHCHTLKGSAASFGYMDFAASCHALENELAVLSSGEVIHVADYAPLRAHLARLRERLNALQQSDNSAESSADSAPLYHAQDLTLKGWQITFRPNSDFFDNGYDPLQILRQLKALGPLQVTVNQTALPEFVDLDPACCYLSWQCELSAAVPESVLLEVFDWIEPLCEYSLTKIKAQRPPDSPLQGVLTQQVNLLGAQLERQQRLIKQLQQTASQNAPQWQALLLAQLEEVNKTLRQDVYKLTMRPLAAAFERLAEQVENLARSQQKQIRLVQSFSALEMDAHCVDKLTDILIQLIRNVVAHGIETPEQRLAAGKSPAGQITIDARRDEACLRIVFKDDGVGIDTEKLLQVARHKGVIDASETPERAALLQLIYHPGITTAETVTSLSGRGVGLDLVRQHMNTLYGRMQVHSVPNQGCEFILEIPLPQALIECQLCQIADQFYAIELSSIVSAFEVTPDAVHHVSGKGQFVEIQQQWVPVMDLADWFKLPRLSPQGGWIVMVQTETHQVAFWLDKLLDAGAFLVKPSQMHYRKINGAAGVVMLGQHQLGLLLDSPYLAQQVAPAELTEIR